MESTASAAQPLHQMWASVAGAWGEHADYIDGQAAGLTERILDLAAPEAGERVLELACGPGGLGLAAAARMAPAGELTLSDVAAEMTAIAAARAEERGLANVSTAVLDIERIDRPDDAYDVVLCREGLMLAAEPARAAAEVRRVLRPGGRFAVSVWGPRERNPWLGVVFDSASEVLGRPVPPPGMPGPFALSDADALEAILTGAGLGAVAVEELDVPRRTASLDEWWRRTAALAGPLARILASLPEDARAAVERGARDGARRYATSGGGLEFPGVALVASGRAG